MPTKLDDNGARSHRFHVKLVGLCENSFNRKKFGGKSCIGTVVFVLKKKEIEMINLYISLASVGVIYT